MAGENVIGAFSENHAERLSGVSRGQLHYWDRIGFLKPSYGVVDRRAAYSRIYSFRDLVSLRVLGSLRNDEKIPLQHLRKVSKELDHMGEDRWTATILYVRGKTVVFVNPRTNQLEEVVGGQRVLDIPLRVAVNDMRQAVRELNRRGVADLGHIIQDRNVMQNEPVFARTRIPVAAVKRFVEAGYADDKIICEYPELTAADIKAARAYQTGPIAA